MATSAGNMLGYYGLLIYGYFAITVGRLFFPTSDTWSPLIFSAGTFGMSFIMRSLGSMVLGSYADRVGCKTTLAWSILLTMLGTTTIAFTPTYVSVGPWSPVIVAMARLLRGFSAGKGSGSATAFMIEHINGERIGYNASWQAVTQGLPHC